MISKEEEMKTILTILLIALVLLYVILGNSVFDILSDLSSTLFFAFATTAMISISALIAIDTAKALNYKILYAEYENLKEELMNHISRNIFTIEVSNEAKNKYQSYKKLKQLIEDKLGENYES